ncbi:hypothetical protein TL16_g11411 [Triparma laevis f. inornata]|uniref:Uncharacterized protein n=1 Tax=Triparma laevis f. inornata TaxID=1714386 RepID=A0A9W7ESN2_9STRA|nr:hypothetical protein TL16_g11411 [Triparma laevis f. inornata]
MGMLMNAIIVVIALVAQFAFMNHPYEHDHHSIGSLARGIVSPDSTPLKDVVAVVTGPTSGIGLETSKTLLKQGATVVGIGRNPKSLAETTAEIEALGYAGTFVSFAADLSDLSAVSSATDEILEQYPSIDFLVNNAGIHYGAPWKTHEIDIASKVRRRCSSFSLFSPPLTQPYSQTKGFDLCFVTNYLSHFLLTEKLLPALEKSTLSDPRIIQVSSTYHWLSDGFSLGTNHPDSPGMPLAAKGDFYDHRHRATAYGNSKLAQVLHTQAVSRRLEKSGSKVKIISICPAWVGTDIAPEGLMRTIVKTFAFTPSQGIYSLLMSLFRPEVKSGDFVGTKSQGAKRRAGNAKILIVICLR